MWLNVILEVFKWLLKKGDFFLIQPHGGLLQESYLSPDETVEFRDQLDSFKKIKLDEIELSDLELLANGAYSPLNGFVSQTDYVSILAQNRLANGSVWTIPITLSIPLELCKEFQKGETVALLTPDEEFAGIMEITDIYHRNREHEALEVFQTLDRKHPGVSYLLSKGEVLLGGKIKAARQSFQMEFPEYHLTPRQLREEFERRSWRTVVAFQTRNPIHRAHEYLQKIALEMVDGLLIHPLVGFTKSGDIPAKVRLDCYQAIIESYFPRKRVALSVFPAAMRYAGPKEAVFHALVRKNYGCTHFIVGRDHAGVGNYYGTYAAQNIFDQFDPVEIGITILKFENTFFCRRCGNMASAKTCPHTGDDQIFLSGTKVREMLSAGESLPQEFTRPEISQILMEYYRKPVNAGGELRI